MEFRVKDLLSDSSFRRYVLNPNQGDSARWKRMIDSKEIDREQVEEARQIILDFYAPLSAEEFESEAIEFRRLINVTASEKQDIISLYEQRRPKRRLWARYAATIAILIATVFTLFYYSDFFAHGNQKQVADAHELIVKKTGKGQKKTIFFPDGTKVKLNSESSITYPVEFDTSERVVTLEGEAFFEVAHNEEWPFTVITNDVRTQVLGTSFNVNSYRENDFIRVALVEGSVKVEAPAQTVLLEPMEMITVSEKEQAVEVTDFEYKDVAGWKDNIIVFKEATFDEVAFTLERWFDVEIECTKKPVFEGGYTGDFADQNLESILEGISSNKFKYSLSGDKVIIY